MIEVNDRRGQETETASDSAATSELAGMSLEQKDDLIQRLGTVAQQQKNYIERLQGLIIEKDFEIADLRVRTGEAERR
jgi:hypothetical protein